MDNQTRLNFVRTNVIAGLLGVKVRNVRQWARQGKIPKLVLPSGRFVFDPQAVVEALRTQTGQGETSGNG
jgi:predicted site-specific integrase-resolvase